MARLVVVLLLLALSGCADGGPAGDGAAAGQQDPSLTPSSPTASSSPTVSSCVVTRFLGPDGYQPLEGGPARFPFGLNAAIGPGSELLVPVEPAAEGYLSVEVRAYVQSERGASRFEYPPADHAFLSFWNLTNVDFPPELPPGITYGNETGFPLSGGRAVEGTIRVSTDYTVDNVTTDLALVSAEGVVSSLVFRYC